MGSTIHKANTSGGVSLLSANAQLRSLPYPYRAMLVICSDLDGTPNRSAHWEIMRFLNTKEETAMGQEIALDRFHPSKVAARTRDVYLRGIHDFQQK